MCFLCKTSNNRVTAKPPRSKGRAHPMTLAATLQRRSKVLLASILAAAAIAGSLAAMPARIKVIVQTRDLPAAERLVRGAGGTITQDLSIINGFAATVPADALARLRAQQAVRAIALDGPVHVLGAPDSSKLRSVYQKSVNADKAWNSGYTGSGVTVAEIDTGIAPVGDLAGRIKNVTTDSLGLQTAPCMNFSGEPNCNDSYGHGTFIA